MMQYPMDGANNMRMGDPRLRLRPSLEYMAPGGRPGLGPTTGGNMLDWLVERGYPVSGAPGPSSMAPPPQRAVAPPQRAVAPLPQQPVRSVTPPPQGVAGPGMQNAGGGYQPMNLDLLRLLFLSGQRGGSNPAQSGRLAKGGRF